MLWVLSLQHPRHWFSPTRIKHSRDKPQPMLMPMPCHAHHAQPHAVKSAPWPREAIPLHRPTRRRDRGQRRGERKSRRSAAKMFDIDSCRLQLFNNVAANLMRECDCRVKKTASRRRGREPRGRQKSEEPIVGGRRGEWVASGDGDATAARRNLESGHGSFAGVFPFFYSSRCRPARQRAARTDAAGDKRKCFIGLNTHCAKTRGRERGREREREKAACLPKTCRA